MRADESGGSKGTASIFKNPFDVEKDQLIRQLFELPVRVAAFVKSHSNLVGGNRASKIELPFSIFAGNSAAKEDPGAKQSAYKEVDDLNWSTPNLRSEDQSIHDAASRQQSTTETTTYGIKKRKRSDQSPNAPPSREYMRKGSVDECLYSETKSQSKLGDAQSKHIEQIADLNTEKKAHSPAYFLAAERRPVAGQNEEAPALLLKSAFKKQPHDVAQFIIMVIRTLRHTRESNMNKLLDLLSLPDFPVEKSRFLEELIQEAECYNKQGIANELAKYRKAVTTCDSHEHEQSIHHMKDNPMRNPMRSRRCKEEIAY